MEILILAALITAFLAGIAALFAPCCIGVLLPAFFGSIFRQKRTVLLMTLVFFFGLLTVFLPLGLGMGFLGQLFKAYHGTIYLVASIFFLFLGLFILSGLHFSLPFRTKSQVKVTGVFSVFILGIFSGFATLCCAPVLAGAMALSALPGSMLWGGLYSVIYVLGMVLPLFIISYFLDKKGIMDKVNIFKKEITYSVFKKKISLTLSNLFSGAVFIIMGGILLYYTLTDRITMNPSESQLKINILLSKLTEIINQFLSTSFGQIAFLVGGVIILFLVIRLIIKKYWRKEK
ncbi:MAG: cytochrome c biogenesis protein CcdA [Candidatus Woesearchaeota archaeon]